MQSLTSLLAWRYIRFKDKSRTIKTMILICMLGIFIGTFALMMTLMISTGFERAITEKMRGINADAIMHAPGRQFDYFEIRDLIKQESYDQVAAISGSMTKQVIVERSGVQTVLVLKGIDPDNDHQVTNLVDKVRLPQLPDVERRNRLSELLDERTILVGTKLAKELYLNLDDRFEMLIPEQKKRKQIGLRREEVQIGGVFEIGLEEYDNNMAFCSLDLLHALFDEEGVDQIHLKFSQPKLNFFQRIYQFFNPDAYREEYVEVLRGQFEKLHISAWHDLYPSLVSSLRLEKYVMFLVIALITLVASMNMISLLFMQIASKRRDVAILRALGATPWAIQKIFIRLGILVVAVASLLGLGAAALFGLILRSYPIITLPDIYYVTRLPIAIEPELFLVVFGLTLLLGLLAIWLPVQAVRRISIVDILGGE